MDGTLSPRQFPGNTMPDTEVQVQSDRCRSTPQESRERLRQRKQRKTTSCWPCRERKVKCDKLQPCDTCSKREHPDLCLYEQPKNRTIAAIAPRSSQSTAATNTSLNAVNPVPHPPIHFETSSAEDTINRPRSTLPDDAPEAFLGENSTPSFVRDQTSADGASGRRTNVERALMPILGLNEAPGPYPFLPLVGDESNIHKGLPPDLDIIKYFQHFRMQLQTFTPIIADIVGFEAKLGRYLDFRARQSANDQPTATETFSPEWIGLIYAVLASGVQFSDLSNDQRSVLSQNYAQYAFQCLRLGNFLMRPTVECLQTFLVLGNVMQNAMKPEAAWIMMGTTARIAQSLGLHKFSDAGLSSTRRKLWLAVVWQDTLLSLCFDRPSATMITLNSAEFMAGNSNIASELGYTEAMYAMIICSLRGLKVKETVATEFDSLSAVIGEIEQIYPRVKSHLHSLDCCNTFQERCEHYALRLHISFAAAWISRGAFRQAPVLESQLQARASLITKGKEYLIQSLKAYLQLQTLCVQASRSWAFIHNGLSSALFLGLIGETKVNPEVRKLQGALINFLSASDSNVQVGQNVALSKLHERALTGLKSLYNDQSTLSRPGTAVQPTNNNLEPSSEQNDNTTGMTQTYTYSETFPYDMVQNNYQQPGHMPGSLEMLGMSPMEIFDSMMWDPNFTSEGFEGLDANPESWIF